tara:strand:+ start:120 stop:278 length:159 start_codon:yes stop_codon:yes gene_type:complete
MLWEHTFLQARLIAITGFYHFISNYIVTESDNALQARVLLQGLLFVFIKNFD